MPDILWSTFEFAGEHLAVVENAWVIPEEAGVWLEAELEVVGTEGVARVHIPGDLSLWLSRGHVLPDTTLVPFVLGTSTGALRGRALVPGYLHRAADETGARDAG